MTIKPTPDAHQIHIEVYLRSPRAMQNAKFVLSQMHVPSHRWPDLYGASLEKIAVALSNGKRPYASIGEHVSYHKEAVRSAYLDSYRKLKSKKRNRNNSGIDPSENEYLIDGPQRALGHSWIDNQNARSEAVDMISNARKLAQLTVKQNTVLDISIKYETSSTGEIRKILNSKIKQSNDQATEKDEWSWKAVLRAQEGFRKKLEPFLNRQLSCFAFLFDPEVMTSLALVPV